MNQVRCTTEVEGNVGEVWMSKPQTVTFCLNIIDPDIQ